MNRTDHQVDIFVNSKPLRQYHHDSKTFIEARVGTEYSIRVKNNSSQSKLAVVTIDGLNAVSGQPQDNSIGRGYIIKPYDSIQISGFRKDLNEVGAFKFCKKESSYCKDKGLPENNGVIGVRIYEEKLKPISWPIQYPLHGDSPYWPTVPTQPSDWTITCADNKSFGLSDNPHSYGSSATNDIVVNNCCFTSSLGGVLRSCSNSAPKFEVGTGWGRKIEDSAIEVPFEANESLSMDYLIYYDSRKNLEAIGISFKKETKISKEYPKAFGAFATPPSGWNG